MMVLFKILLVFCVIFILNWQCVDSGRGRGSSRGRITYRTNKGSSSGVSGSSGGGWWSWLRGGSSKGNAPTTTTTTGARGASPPSLSHKVSAQSPSRVGFAAYGNNYEANFHHSQTNHFRPVSHPYQSHFQPQTTAVFAYHFMPSTHVHHIHHYVGSSGSSSSSSHEPVFYDYRNSSISSTPSVKEPIIYNYKPPIQNESSSEEDEPNMYSPANPNDVFIAGVENMLLYGSMKDNQHQVLFIAQGSDGISFEDELMLKLDHFEPSENANLHYFPDVEFRFDAEDEPNDDDLQNIYQMYKNLVDDGRC